MGARKLKGMDGCVSPVEYLNMVKEIVAALLSDHINQMGWVSSHVSELRDVFSSVDAYLAQLGDGTDLTWQGKFPPSVLQFWDLLESLLFSNKFFTTIENGVKHHRGVAEIVACDEIKSALANIKQTTTAENSGGDATTIPVESSVAQNRSQWLTHSH